MASQRPAGLGTSRQNPETTAAILGLLAVAAIVTAVVFGIDIVNFDVIVGLLTVMTLTLVTIPVLRWVARVERDPTLGRILMWGLVFKIAFTMVRYFFIVIIYGDNGDAGVYSGGGAILMDFYRRGIFFVTPPALASRGQETARIAVVVGLVYLVTGVSRYAASFVFSWLCFAGQVFMFRAFRRGVPEADSHRYLALVLFLPSMLFWPSSIGKEALMVFCVGIVSFGAAQLLGSRVRLSGILTFLLGAAGLFFIRPHMALIAITALGFASAVSSIVGFKGELDKKASSRAFAVRMAALLVLIGAASLATTQLSKVLGDGTSGADGISGILDRAKAQTAEGGSQFDPPAVTSPIGLPNAIVTVLFRPFPWEAHNVNGVIASAEGVILFGLCVTGRRRLLRWCQLVGRRPYLVFCAAFAMTFIIAFSYIGNFGILARQRTQMIPLALTFLGLPAAARVRSSWFGSRGKRSKEAALEQQASVRAPKPRSELIEPRLQSTAASQPADQRPRGEGPE